MQDSIHTERKNKFLRKIHVTMCIKREINIRQTYDLKKTTANDAN